MTDAERRNVYVAGLRELATFLEQHTEAPLPSDSQIVYCWGNESFLPAVKALGTCKKDYSPYYATISRMFGPIKYGVQISRESVCTKKVVGKKLVPERLVPSYYEPAREEDIVEWDCHPLLAETQESQNEPESPENEQLKA